MTKRKLWVVEAQSDKGWEAVTGYQTRDEARWSHKEFWKSKVSRIRLYVPAEEREK